MNSIVQRTDKEKVADIIYKNFPVSSLKEEILSLPESAQKEFLYEYSRRMKTIGLGYLTHFFFGASYAYQDKWFKQILFWLTGFGFGIGWVINLFRMPEMIRGVNLNLARKITRRLKARHYLSPKPQKMPEIRKAVHQHAQYQPRKLHIPFNPAELNVENLKPGYLIDFEIKTWTVVNEQQYDLESNETEREFKLATDIEQTYLNLRKEGGQLLIISFNLSNIHAIDSQLYSEIQSTGTPKNVLMYKDETYYRENMKFGLLFNISSGHSNAKRVKIWEYFDQERLNVIRIEKTDDQAFRTFVGRIVSPHVFSDIYPKSDASNT